MSLGSIVQIDVSKSADFNDQFYVVDQDEEGEFETTCGGLIVPCSPRDLSASTLTGVLAPSFNFATVIDTFSSADIPIVDVADGLAAFAIKQARVASWPVGHWVFVVRQNFNAGGSVEVMRGPFNVVGRPF